jgi:DNA-binding transcriptional LysR family regulator
MVNVTLRQLEYFVAAADTGSVSEAARQVHLSQSAVSTALADLERTLETQLLVRSSRGLALTPAGRRLLVDARRLLGGAESLELNARHLGKGLTGRLSVGCYSTLAPVMMPGVIADFAERHPDVELDFMEGSHAFLERQLREGRCEVALMYNYDFHHGRLSAEFGTRVVAAAPPHLLLPLQHPLAEASTAHLAQVAGEPLILFDLEPGGEYFLGIFDRLGLSPQIRLRTASYEMVRALVARGLGYSLLTQRTTLQTSYEGRGFVTVPLADELPALQIVVAQVASTRPTKRAAAFIEQCLESLTPTAGRVRPS